MTKAHEQRVRNSLERTRVRLHQRKTEVEAAEQALRRERAEALAERSETIALLQVLCAQYGDPDWDPSLAIPEILERKLMGPLLEAATRWRDRAKRAEAALRERDVAPVAPIQAPPAAPVAGPVTQRPSLRMVPPTSTVHRVTVVRARDGTGRPAYRVICTCPGWHRIVSTEAEGWRVGQEHEEGVPQEDRRRSAR